MIYLDMDGVLADFVKHIRSLDIPINHQWHEPQHLWTPETWESEKTKVAHMHSPDFWTSIPVMPGGQELWDFCHRWAGPPYVSVLTAKPRKDSPELVAQDKFKWLNVKLGYIYPLEPSAFHCVAHGEKQKYLQPGDILVDDDKRNGVGLVEGAHFIYHTDAIDTINKIKEIYS